MKEARVLNLIVLLLCFTISFAQKDNSAIKAYNEFKNKIKQDYIDFRLKANSDYVDFLKKAWNSYESGPIIPKPKEKELVPIIRKENAPIKDNEVEIDSIITPIIINNQPTPPIPIYEQSIDIRHTNFVFFGTNAKVRIPTLPESFMALNNNISEKKIAEEWDKLCNKTYDNLIRDCLALRLEYKLSDWAYLLMLRELSETICGKQTNAATLLTSWIFTQTGYQSRLAMANGRLFLLFASNHIIFELPYFTLDNTSFYPLLNKDETWNPNSQLKICAASFPDEKPLSLYISDAQLFTENNSSLRTIKSENISDLQISVSVNKNLIDFFSTYPTSALGNNFCTRWAMYANTPINENVKNQIYPTLDNIIKEKSELDAANLLLNLIQTGLTYEYDERVWGEDRAFFAEETLFYPYADCEDRSILFTRLVRDLLGLDCLLVYYPGHLATAVNFSDSTKGDYIILQGKKYTICDPTYIGAPVGATMPEMDNSKATVILLNR